MLKVLLSLSIGPSIEYSLIFSILCLVTCLSALILLASCSITSLNKSVDFQKLLAYECGFQPFEDSRHLYNIKYYIIGILFVIFDLEIIFLFPWSISLTASGFEGFVTVFLFIILLTGV